MDVESLISGVIAQDVRSIAKSITLLESTLKQDQEASEKFLKKLMPHVGKAKKIGISGIPGVGKSTFIDSLGSFLLQKDQNIKIGVLAVDPSSPLHGGSILGDKTRMDTLAKHPRAYVRPSPSGKTFGGVSRKSRECMLVLDAAGFDFILVETIGVGQAEYLVASMVDALVMLQMPSTGDELQGMKKGILELADIIGINKADGGLLQAAKKSHLEHEGALKLLANHDSWVAPVHLLSSAAGTGLAEIWDDVERFLAQQEKTGQFTEKRQQQLSQWFERELSEQIKDLAESHELFAKTYKNLEQQVLSQEVAPSFAAKEFIRSLMGVC